MSNPKAGGAGSLATSSPVDAPGNAPASGKDVLQGLNVDAMGGVLEAINKDPQSLQLSMLGPFRDQLEALENDPDNDFSDDPRMQMLSKVVQGLVQTQIDRLNEFCADEMESFYDAVESCRSARDCMIDDERQWRAMSRLRDSKAFPSDAPDRNVQDSDRICDHTTRSRTTLFAARLGDMIYPTNDYPIRVKAPDNPKPEEYPGFKAAQDKLVQAATQAAQAQYQQAMTAFQQSQQPQQGQPQPTPGTPPPQPPPINPDDCLTIKDYADAAAQKMQAWVFQQLDNMHFRRKARETLQKGSKLGAGLLYGPYPEPSKRRVPKPVDDGKGGTTLDMQIEETMLPGCEARDAFRFFYDMTETLDRSNACYYLNLWTERELAEFKAYPNVIVPTVEALEEDDPPDIDSRIVDAINRRTDGSGMKEPLANRWPVVEVDRVIKPDKLEELLGIEWEGADMPLVKLWMCEGKCLKFKLTPLERDWRPPYYNFGIMPKDETIFWYSVPSMGRAAQKGIDGALNATLFNAAAAAAPMIVTNRGQIAPNNERWRINGMVVMNNLNPDIPPANAIASVGVESNVDGNLNMLQVMKQMFDDDTLFQQILMGNISGEEIAASQLAQIVNLASVFQRMLAGYADDYLHGPFVERCVWWGNIYGDDVDMKGPHVVTPIAATQFVAKDILIQHFQAYEQICAQPDYQGFSDKYKRFRVHTALLDIPDIQDTIYDRETALKNQSQAQQGQASAEAVKMADVQRQAEKDKMDNALAQAKLQQEGNVAIMEMRTNLQIATIRERTALVQLMTQKQVDLAAVQADLMQTTNDNDTQKQIAALDKTIEARLAVMSMTKPEPSDPHSKFD